MIVYISDLFLWLFIAVILMILIVSISDWNLCFWIVFSVEVILRAEAVETAQAGDKCDFIGTVIVVPDVGSLSLTGAFECMCNGWLCKCAHTYTLAEHIEYLDEISLNLNIKSYLVRIYLKFFWMCRKSINEDNEFQKKWKII